MIWKNCSARTSYIAVQGIQTLLVVRISFTSTRTLVRSTGERTPCKRSSQENLWVAAGEPSTEYPVTAGRSTFSSRTGTCSRMVWSALVVLSSSRPSLRSRSGLGPGGRPPPRWRFAEPGDRTADRQQSHPAARRQRFRLSFLRRHPGIPRGPLGGLQRRCRSLGAGNVKCLLHVPRRQCQGQAARSRPGRPTRCRSASLTSTFARTRQPMWCELGPWSRTVWLRSLRDS